MSNLTALAIVTADATGRVIPGVACFLRAPELPGGFIYDVTNNDGYASFAVPIPFNGVLKLSGAAQAYGDKGNGVPVSVNAQDVTLRVGPTASSPQDLQLPACVPFKKGSVLPAVPTRDQVCGLRTSLQGLNYNTTQYGPIPAWWYPILSVQDRAIARAAHRAVGDTHIPVSISAAYKESGTLWPETLKQGYDFTQDLTTLRAICTEIICDGLYVDMPLAGDGMGSGPGYNDLVGNTYGYQWLMDNLSRIIHGLKGDGTLNNPDLTPYIIFRPGWDACFYGWGVPGEVPDLQPTRVRLFGELFRTLLPQGYLAIEHTPGNIPCGEGGGDYAPGGLMRNYDTILSEFNTVHEDSCWQIVARMVRPYFRPVDQPLNDDLNPPFYLAPGTERGPYFYVAFEPTKGGVYEWCRGYCSLDDVNATRSYLRSLGCRLTG